MARLPNVLSGAVLALTWLSASGLPAQPEVSAVLDLASYSTGLAPGTLVSVFGTGLASDSISASDAPLPTLLGGASLDISDGVQTLQAPLFYVSPTQINAQIPYEIAGSRAEARVRNASGTSTAVSLTILPQAPRLFTTNGTGEGFALLLHADNSLVSTGSPARVGEVLNLYLIGLGAVTPPIASGAPAGGGSKGGPLSLVAGSVTVKLDDREAPVLYAGLSPSSVGLYQVQFQVPTGVLTDSPALSVAAQQRTQANVNTALSTASGGQQHYVAPGGKPGGSGSKADPWDLVTALKQPSAIKPGDTIWLRGGVYGDGSTEFVSSLSGTASRPIVLRQYPDERATINGSVTVNGTSAWYWGFEVTNNLPTRQSTIAGSFGGLRTWGINVNGPNTKFINLVLHDADAGFGFWSPAENSEIYGCLIYDNGWQGPDRGHGHGIYTQNTNGTKHIGDNIIFNQFDLGIQAYGSGNAFVQGFSLDGNIVFNNGVLSAGSQRADNILFGFPGSISGLHLDSNYTYDTPTAESGYSRVGWSFGGFNKDAVITNNYWIGGYFSVDLWNWDSLTFSNNTAYSTRGTTVGLTATNNQKVSNYTFTGNSYYGSGLFSYNAQTLNANAWKSATQLDPDSQVHSGRPQGIWAFVRGNTYEPGRANIVIFNWDLAGSVGVDVSQVLTSGTKYEIRDAENFYGSPVASGTYSGDRVQIPMTNLTVANPVGNVPTTPAHTAPEFGAFVLITK